MPPPRPPHVALLIETSRTYGRQMLAGIRQWTAEHRPWSVFMEPRSLQSRVPPWLKHWRGDGILTRTESPATARAIASTALPVVELRASRLKHPWPFVGIDNREMGRLIADHLLERGFRHFGVFEIGSQRYFEQRRDNFIQAVQEAGFSCSVHHAGVGGETPAQWERQQDALARWVQKLPKPLGLMACTDQLGFWLLDACRRASIAVPEQVAVVGVENDESLCSMADPPLSSVALDGQAVGYAAARLLDRLMRGGRAPARPTLIKPLGVVTRQSSDVIAIDDRQLATALRLIRQRGPEGANVDQILSELPLSRSNLERRMKRVLGRTPLKELQRVRLAHARTLLEDTALSIAEIAETCGYRHPQHFHAAFKKCFAQTPGQIRARPREGL